MPLGDDSDDKAPFEELIGEENPGALPSQQRVTSCKSQISTTICYKEDSDGNTLSRNTSGTNKPTKALVGFANQKVL